MTELQKQIEAVLNKFGEDLATDMNESFNKALKDGGSKNVQEAKLNFNPKIKVSSEGINLQIVGSDDYWRYVESGRKPGTKRPPSKALGKKWQNLNGINPSNIVYDIMVKYYKKKGLTRTVKKLPFDKASKQLSYIFSASIGKKGIKPKPFKDRVVKDDRFAPLRQSIAELVGQRLAFEITTK